MGKGERLPQIDMSYDPGKGYVAENELMRAIILRAIEDYRNGKGEARDEAIEYLNDEDDEYVFSFIAICRHLGFDPGKTREKILHGTKRISTRRRAA